MNKCLVILNYYVYWEAVSRNTSKFVWGIKKSKWNQTCQLCKFNKTTFQFKIIKLSIVCYHQSCILRHEHVLHKL